MKKTNLVLEPMLADESVLVQYTDTVQTDKHLAVKVPNGYQAIVFIDEKVAFKINTCFEKSFAEYGKEYMNRQCRIAYVRTKLLSPMIWGFGNIQVKNDCLKEAYRVGANGKYTVEIAEVGRLINCFDSESNITIDDIKEKTISIIKNIGTALLGGYFANTDVSVFEISSLTADFRERLFAAVKNETAFTDLGICLKDLVVDGIHVNEEDLDMIRNRINEPENKQQEPTVDYVEDLRQARQEITAELSERFNAQLKEFQDTIASSLEEKIQELLPLQETAKEDYVGGIRLTAEMIIDNAETEDDFIPAVAMLYSNIEENLINKFHLRHENKTFVIPFDEYKKISEEARIGNYYILKRRSAKTGVLEEFIPHVIQYDANRNPVLVEMLPVVRFIKAGLDTETAKKASEIWIVLNKIRHKSQENIECLNKSFSDVEEEREYLLSALAFFKDHGLYTKA